MMKVFKVILGFFGVCCISWSAAAGQINVAVASNALAALKVISAEFEKQTGDTVKLSSGSTGKLYAQITNGAPYDVFLAANEHEPQMLEQHNLVVKDSRFTYALGKLVAWSSNKSLLQTKSLKEILLSLHDGRIAIANPKTAPYGMAAQQVFENLGLWSSLRSNLIRGENVSQTYQFAKTNNAKLCFIALSQILNDSKMQGGFLEVPQSLHQPIKQQAVWLLRADKNPVASEFLDFLKSSKAQTILTKQFGYAVEVTRGKT